jgi:quinol monooxygenase YgiN
MYIVRNEAEVTLGRAAEFESTVDELVAIHQQNPGYVGSTLLQSYGNPGRYTLTSRWTDRAASLAASRTDRFKEFARSFITSGLVRPLRLTEAYESVFEVDQDSVQASDSTAERWIDLTLTSPMVAPAFEVLVRELSELSRQSAPGILSVRLRRSLGTDTKYLLLIIVADHAAARGWLLVPEVQAFMQSQSMIPYLVGSPSAETYAVVKRYVGPALASVQGAATAARQ